LEDIYGYLLNVHARKSAQGRSARGPIYQKVKGIFDNSHMTRHEDMTRRENQKQRQKYYVYTYNTLPGAGFQYYPEPWGR